MTFTASSIFSPAFTNPCFANRFGDILVKGPKLPWTELRTQIERTTSTYAPPLSQQLIDRPNPNRSDYRGIIETGLNPDSDKSLAAELTQSLTKHGFRFLPVEPFDLTPVHLRILPLLSEGKQNQHIAEMLGCSKRTIDTQLGIMYKRMGVSSRTQAMIKAKERGLIALG
jgi:DNA-binding CsgD family transcriptional regulator